MASKRFQFHYVESVAGTISGRDFRIQTEDAINAVGEYAYNSTTDATEALRLANQALSNSTTAQNNAATALANSNAALTRVGTLEGAVNTWGVKIQDALSQAGSAVSTSNEAKSLAQTAVETSNSALDTSKTANTKSDEALLTAKNALLKSEQAVSTSTEAKEIAQNAMDAVTGGLTEAGGILSEMNGLLEDTREQATIATTQAQNSAGSATSAASQAELAKRWANWVDNAAEEGDEPDHTVDGTEYSSKWYAQLSADSATESEASATDSKASEVAAKASEDAAEASADTARNWAEKLDGPVSGNQYSARFWVQRAEEEARNASASAKDAKMSENAAAGSATAAKTSEGNAKTSETNAAASAEAAKASEDDVAASAAAALASQNAAKASQDAAKLSETNAKASEVAAKASEDAAEAAMIRAEDAAAANRNAVVYTAQTLTAEEQAQARTNISALGKTDFATTADAEAGADETKVMNPARTKEAILRLAPAPDLSGYATKAELSQVASSAVPPGTMIHFSGPNIPPGWLICNGAWVNKQQFAALYAAIGGRYGEDAVNFGIPNVDGRFLECTTNTGIIGQYVEAGLPNITGVPMGAWSSDRTDIQVSGAFYVEVSGVSGRFYEWVKNWKCSAFSANRNAAAFGASSTVTPKSYKAVVLIKI